MAAYDDLSTAVDQAVSEMTKAADYIRNHPATSNDAGLRDMANRLAAAANALSGVDVEQVVSSGTTSSSTVSAGGTDTSTGTVSDTGTVSNGGTVTSP